MTLSAAVMSVLAVTAWLGAVGTIRYVRATGCSPTGPGTPASPYCKIQDAVCASASGDEVRVLPGTYAEAVRMRPNVSLIAWLPADPNNIPVGAPNPDPNATIINAANQPCNNSDLCTKRAGSQCSVVTFGSGHTTATRLEGFTLTGGKGRLPLTGDPPFVGGGGLYVFSSPTIVNNVITNNVMAGPPHDLRGAGIYVASGGPIISGNSIQGNRAVPPPGSSSTNPTYGYGGGIWASHYATPMIINNVIQANWAADPNALNSLGEGGGIVLFTGQQAVGATVDRNLIADNVADFLGGGLALDIIGPTSAQAVATNNVIVGNRAKNGGGVSIYLNKANLINNTITGNEGLLGGGVWLGRGDVTLPVSITNNIIESNTLQVFGDAGGLYTHDLDPASNPTIEHNLLWGNERNQVSGDRTDGDTIGVDGNFASDPLYVNRAARDLRLAGGSPAIDRALASKAPPVDHNNVGRGIDGNGIPDNPAVGDVDIGAFERLASCIPATEVCNGVDDDCDTSVDEDFSPQPTTCGVGACQRSGSTSCVSGTVTDSCVPGTPAPSETCNGIDDTCNGQTDEGFLNTDGDAQADCVDPDDDNDGAADASDCAPLDASAFGNPGEVELLAVVGASPTAISFAVQGIGSGTRYEIVSGLLSRLLATRGFQEGFCIAGMASGGTYNDVRQDPPPGDGWYYLIRAANGCGNGTFGSALADAPGAGDVCPQGVVDLDADGSPSDLDCNDNDPAVSPLRADVCNGVSDDCDAQVDEDFTSEPTACGVGACESSGATSCASGTVVDSCTPGTPGPSDTTCNSVDENCNGTADEQYASQPTTCGVGACQRSGATSCLSGSVQDSCVPGAPSAETCDAVDNDCDAVVDDGFDLGQACSGQTGTCQAQGTTVCSADGSEAICSAGGIFLGVDLMGASVVLEWNAFPGVAAYDVVRGSLSQLLGTSGDFGASLLECLANDLAATSLGEPGSPPPGDGFWYLVRGSSCGSGSYESGDPGQVGTRGPEIESSGQRCP